MRCKLTHVDEKGRARMVDVGGKAATQRIAIARGTVAMKRSTLAMISSKSGRKGDVLQVARIAGISAAKETGRLIPLCHPLALTNVAVDLSIRKPGSVVIEARVEAYDRTGVEMEALTAVAVAALTVYDMCKAVDKEMVISDILLREKIGGKSGHYCRGKSS